MSSVCHARSYHQVQTWLKNEKDPLKWRWHTPSGLPKKSEKDPVTESLLQCISQILGVLLHEWWDAGKRVRIVLYYANIAFTGCLAKLMPVILDNEFKRGDAPAPILTWLMNNWNAKTLNCK
ncbi:hypothetical protein AVEN_191237-1 [Araneus ventricosus]|uniref:Uncharacterized protein n=1 Tax=Araneus ventricosus TaxID=182803 RepID=A0A4Y2GCV9_ARAVE|nr:hypothetical protein AVEN_191237-1 [Araneus ventricosus]